MMVVHDTRPFGSIAGECLRCGFEYHSELYIMDKETLDARRADYDISEGTYENIPYTKEQLENMKHFDNNYKPEDLNKKK